MNNANASRHRTVGNVVNEAERRERQQAQRIADLEAEAVRLRHLIDTGIRLSDDIVGWIADIRSARRLESVKGNGDD
jgi:hypothetical protein